MSFLSRKMSKRIVYLLTVFFLFGTGPSFAQQPEQPGGEPAQLKDIIHRATQRKNEYKIRFKDLTAEEEQSVEEYDGQGKLKKQRRISSDLIIYQSQLDSTMMVEYRDVKSIDGVAIAKREARLVSLVNKSAKADSVKKELERINRESSRYDLQTSVSGLTLNQGLPLDENARASFQFKLAGREPVNGKDAVVISYQQVAPIPGTTFKFSSASALKGAEPFYRGRLWLDAETAQLRREERELTLRIPSLSHPLTWMKYELEYSDSRFGFLTPQRIVVSTYSRGRTGADNAPELLLGGKVTFQYGAFSRFDVDVPDASVNPPPKP
jgi:uncharacterized LabA/DUF88 family protein